MQVNIDLIRCDTDFLKALVKVLTDPDDIVEILRIIHARKHNGQL